MKKRLVLPLLLIATLLLPIAVTAQSDDACDLDFLTADFLGHFNEARSIDERLNLTFEYLNFVLICTQKPDCETLNTFYAERFEEAATLEEMLLLNTSLTADLLICSNEQDAVPGEVDSSSLETVFAELGFECAALDADPFYIHAECSGEHDADAAQSLYDAVLEYFDVESVLFDVRLTDDRITTAYTYTGTGWLEPQIIP